MGNKADNSRRLFFALWPDTATRAYLTQILRGLVPPEARAIHSENLHITLVFLGHQDRSAQHCAEQAAAQLRATPFSITLDCLGHWPRPRILWLGALHYPAALPGLAADLHQALTPCRMTLDSRPYQPHLTFARNVRKMETLPVLPACVDWHVRDFVLAESIPDPDNAGTHYRVLARWPLQAPKAPPESARCFV